MIDQNKITEEDVQESPICYWRYGVRVHLLQEEKDCYKVFYGTNTRTTAVTKKEILFLN